MVGSIAQGRFGSARSDPFVETPEGRRWSIAVGLALVALALLIYVASNPHRYNFYDHFTWQASAFLDGQAGIRFPVAATATSPGNDYFLDVLPILDANGQPTGRGLIPYPPLPAVLLLPFVAIWGLATNAELIAAVIGAIDVGLAWWMLGRLPLRLSIRVATTVFFAVGTVFWYSAMEGTTWYFAHIVAIGFTLLAIGAALGGDREAAIEAVGGGAGTASSRSGGWSLWPHGHGALTSIDRRQFLAGLGLGLAATARLTVIFGLPFLVLVGSGGSIARRALWAGIGAALPVLVLLTYNFVATGHIFHPAYEYTYQLEAYGYPQLGYHPDWSIEDLRYVPQNLALMLFGTPAILPPCDPGAARGVFDATCPVIVPQAVGMSLVLTSPGYLLTIPALARFGRDRIVTGAALAVAFIAFVNLMHFSQGWVQFGYRFSNDFAPFMLLLIALGLVRLGGVGWRAGILIGLSIVINLWGVIWGLILGW
ncbi:MAG TPA: hypothetical protein VNF73_05525 [Candidatus Saccharimonadales bacterium]|nr:hypothetical protein [Candidatus Saccharimonadales bacterium]